MMQSPRRLVNAGLRGFALASRFLLIFALARLLEPADFATYGLLFAAVTFMVYAIGFDFYKYANRELIASESTRWRQVLRDQAVFYGAAYAVLLPASLLAFLFGVLSLELMPWFVALVVIEHVGHEIGRVLIAMSDQVAATVTLVIRTGAWVLVAIPLMWYLPAHRSLDMVLAAWTIGGIIACVVGGARIRAASGTGAVGPIDRAWIAKGVRVSAKFLLATLALKGIITLDRYWVDAVGGLETAAAYILFVSIANALKAFLDSGVFVFSYPTMIRAAAQGDVARFDAAMRAMARETLWVTLAVAAAALVLIHPLLEWVDQPVYLRHLDLFYFAMCGAVLYSFGMVAHYGAYAFRLDRTIVASQLAGFAAFTLSAPFLAGWTGSRGVAAAVCIGYTVILGIKYLALRKHRIQWQRSQ